MWIKSRSGEEALEISTDMSYVTRIFHLEKPQANQATMPCAQDMVGCKDIPKKSTMDPLWMWQDGSHQTLQTAVKMAVEGLGERFLFRPFCDSMLRDDVWNSRFLPPSLAPNTSRNLQPLQTLAVGRPAALQMLKNPWLELWRHSI